VIDDVTTMRSEIGIIYLSDFTRQVMTKLLSSHHLEFHHLIDCGVYVYLWKGHPLAEQQNISFSDLESYPCLTFEQGDKSSFYLAEEIFSTSDYARVIKACDRSTMLNLMKGLNGYTFCSGIICGSLNGSDYTAVPLSDDNSVMEIGYITRRNVILSEVGNMYISKLREYLEKM
ncbi:MAG: LysR family transcriptional regulator substrate-binding protein, partial [Porcipelethomonas sp.]